MTIKRTRELMGDELKDKTDAEVLEFIQQWGGIADAMLDVTFDRIKKGFAIIDGKEFKVFDDNGKRILNKVTKEFHKKDREWLKKTPEQKRKANGYKCPNYIENLLHLHLI